MKGIPNLSARVLPSSCWTSLSATLMSILLATSILTTSLDTCSFICLIHFSIYEELVTDVLEGLIVRNRISEDDAWSPLIIRLSNIPVSFLTGRIPDLELKPSIPHLQCFDFKIDSNGGYIVELECPLAESHQYVSFANPTIADNYQFEKMLIFFWNIIHGFSFYYEIKVRGGGNKI